ncbi:hypothetical protein F5878DRAFT_667644 [Lentinula raphanica]|uniref:Uncharacterized protein n=1 Tax=Lentinula raphanica TaxID=153919 RepID=A0AA38NVE3_9AGAR|nr:hypothetical protein F5878DRAFT_667644 [Lentinula raphanica]
MPHTEEADQPVAPRTPSNKEGRSSIFEDAHKTPGESSPNRIRRKTPGSQTSSRGNSVSPTPINRVRRSTSTTSMGSVNAATKDVHGDNNSSQPPHADGERDPSSSHPTNQNQSDRMSTASDHGVPNGQETEVMDELMHASMVLAPGSHLPTILNMEPRNHNAANEDLDEENDDSRGSGAATPTPDPPFPTYDQEKLKIPRDRNLRPNRPRPEQEPTDPGFAEFLMRVATAPASLNNGWMPQFVQDLETSLRGYPEEMRTEVLEHPEEWVIITIFNSGVYLFRRIPDMAQRVADFLISIGIDFDDILAPYRDKIEEEAALASRSRGRGGGNPQATRGCGRGRGRGGKTASSKAQGADLEDKYGGSTTLAVRVSDIDQRHYLLGLGTTALDTLVAFHATKVWYSPDPVPYERSWAAGLFHTNQYGRTSDVMTDNLAYTVKTTLWESVTFGNLIARANPGPASTRQKVIEFTDSFEFILQPYKYKSANINQACWILFAAPVSRHPDPITRARQENEIRRFIVAPPFGQYRWRHMVIFPHAIECKICKLDDHPTFSCPFTQADTWFGPRKQVREVIDDHFKEEKAQSSK